MTVTEALSAIQQVGTVSEVGGVLKLKLPETAVADLRPALETLRSGKAQAIELLNCPAQVLDSASRQLGRAGVRLMFIGGEYFVGIWADVDSPELRAALHVFGIEPSVVRYLDGAGIPPRYKVREVAGEPVPASVLAAMEREPSEPWVIRDRMMALILARK